MQNLEIVRIDAERQLLLVRGAVPGFKNGDVMVLPTTRATRPAVAKPAGKAAPAGAKR